MTFLTPPKPDGKFVKIRLRILTYKKKIERFFVVGLMAEVLRPDIFSISTETFLFLIPIYHSL
jgi:hypothetical protein